MLISEYHVRQWCWIGCILVQNVISEISVFNDVNKCELGLYSLSTLFTWLKFLKQVFLDYVFKKYVFYTYLYRV